MRNCFLRWHSSLLFSCSLPHPVCGGFTGSVDKELLFSLGEMVVIYFVVDNGRKFFKKTRV